MEAELQREDPVILAVDPGLCDLGWAVVAPHTGSVTAIGALHQVSDPELNKSTGRALRQRRAAEELVAVVNEHRCTAIAAEAMSFSPKRFNMAMGLGISWGGIATLSATLGLVLYELPPKRWQAAVLGRDPKDRSKISYEDVFKALAEYLRHGAVWQQFNAIRERHRTHALDAVGVGVFTALRPEQATRIGAP